MSAAPGWTGPLCKGGNGAGIRGRSGNRALPEREGPQSLPRSEGARHSQHGQRSDAKPGPPRGRHGQRPRSRRHTDDGRCTGRPGARNAGGRCTPAPDRSHDADIYGENDDEPGAGYSRECRGCSRTLHDDDEASGPRWGRCLSSGGPRDQTGSGQLVSYCDSGDTAARFGQRRPDPYHDTGEGFSARQRLSGHRPGDHGCAGPGGSMGKNRARGRSGTHLARMGEEKQ